MTQVIEGIEYYTGAEVAALLGVKKETLYAYVSRGVLKSYRQRVGRHRLYRRDEVDRLRAVRGAAAQPAPGAPAAPDTPEPGQSGAASEGLPDVADWIGDH